MELAIILSVLIIGLGLLYFFKPDWNWSWTEKWKSDGNAEPSELYIKTQKSRGISYIILGIFFLCLLLSI